jgi:calpain-15
MAGLAEFSGAVHNLFKDNTLEEGVNPDGMYTVHLFNPTSKMWESVTVDDWIPTKNGEPLMAKPQGNEMWVLLLEKAFAKWFGSYCQIQGAYCMVAHLMLVDCGAPCTVFTQNPSGQPPFNENSLTQMNCVLNDAHNRNSVGLAPTGIKVSKDQLWQALRQADEQNHVMAAWTCKDPVGGAAGRGASGEVIAADGIVKGHAYSLISAREVKSADGRPWRCVQIRNPWGANPAAEYKGELSDNWSGWSQYPQLKKQLLGEGGKLDGMFWMTFDNFVARYSDCGIVPKAMPTAKVGLLDAQPEGKHGRRFGLPSFLGGSTSVKKDKQDKKPKSGGCC